MPYWLAQPGDALQHTPLKRFDPRFWIINFPRPMMAAVTTIAADALRVDCTFYKGNDLCGLAWEAEDKWDHPLLAYETNRDFRHVQLRFRWRSAGIMPLDAINGPTLTIEGRDSAGVPRTWYVRLWNYAEGAPEDAAISLDFGALEGGFLLPGEADPVWAGDVDRMFLSLVPPGFTGLDTALPAPVEGWVELAGMVCEGSGSVLDMGDVIVPEHGLSIATGYDDSYNLTPARLIRNVLQLGYRGAINHYVGMSHYLRLESASGGFYASLAGGAINAPCAAWHTDFVAKAKEAGFGLILSLSYELFDAHCWGDWKQRAWNGDPALTGWSPPSTLLSPAHAGAMGYLQTVARAFVGIAVAAGHAPRFQIGEPWWWIMPDGRICLYDDAAKAALGGSPVEIANIRSLALTPSQKALLDSSGVLLAASTAALVNAVRADHPACEALLLIYLPTVLDEAAPDAKRANVPLGWADPAFDVLQLEDYDWVTAGNSSATARGVGAIEARLGYPVARQHYLSGFVLTPDDQAQWRPIDRATEAARVRGVAATFIWALPQVMRDGFTHFDLAEDDVQAFDDVAFPLSIGREASVTPGFSTQIVTVASGHEQRNMDWASGRMRFDAGPGVRSETDLQTLIAFFRARRGAAKGFRFRDPLDHSSHAMTGAPTPFDQELGTGDGITTQFALNKIYGTGPEAELRRITRPEPASVLVAAGGVAMTAGWALEAGGMILFDAAPAPGAAVTAGFRFDVPVRFAEDSLTVDPVIWAGGDAGSVPLIEIREE